MDKTLNTQTINGLMTRHTWNQINNQHEGETGSWSTWGAKTHTRQSNTLTTPACHQPHQSLFISQHQTHMVVWSQGCMIICNSHHLPFGSRSSWTVTYLLDLLELTSELRVDLPARKR